MSGKRVEILRGKVCGVAADLVQEYNKLRDELVTERRVVRELQAIIEQLEAKPEPKLPEPKRYHGKGGRTKDSNSKEQRVQALLRDMLVPGVEVRRKEVQELMGIEITSGQFSRCKRIVLKEQGRYVPRRRRVVPGGGNDYVF